MPQVMLVKKSHQSDQNSQVWTARVLSAGLGGSGFLQFFRCIVGKLGEIYRFTGFWRHQIKR